MHDSTIAHEGCNIQTIAKDFIVGVDGGRPGYHSGALLSNMPAVSNERRNAQLTGPISLTCKIQLK